MERSRSTLNSFTTLTADKRRLSPPQEKSPGSDEERQAVLLREFREDLIHWISSDPRTALRIMRLIEEILREPFSGLGKPEPLKYGWQGQWSRRITEADRLIYRVRNSLVFFAFARGHYGR